jgi:hypothetical protein
MARRRCRRSSSLHGRSLLYAGDYPRSGLFTVGVAGGDPVQLTSDTDQVTVVRKGVRYVVRWAGSATSWLVTTLKKAKGAVSAKVSSR